MKKKLVCALLIGMMVVQGCGQPPSGTESVSKEEQTTESENQEEEVKDEAATDEDAQTEDVEATEEAEVKEEKPERLNTTKFENLPKVVEQVGFDFRAPEKFSNGIIFKSFGISEEYEKDENGEPIGEPYPKVTLQYYTHPQIDRRDISMYPMEGEIEHPVTYVHSKEINGIEVHFREYTLRMVAADYEMTEEDWELQDTGTIGFSCDGETVGVDIHFRDAYWEEDGIYYETRIWQYDVPYEEIEGFVEEYLNSEYQGEK